MRLSWRERLRAAPDLRTFANWSLPNPQSLPARHRAAYLRNRQIVEAVLAGAPLREVAKTHRLTPARVSQLLDRCLGGEDHKDPALGAGLVPQRWLRRGYPPEPATENVCPPADVRSFSALLAVVPGLKEGLNKTIEASVKGSRHSQRLTPQRLHGEFKRLLAEAVWPTDCYPYNTASLAYASVRRYLHQQTAVLQALQAKRRAFAKHRKLERTEAIQALDQVQIDAHRLDLSATVHLALDGRWVPLRAARAMLLVAIDLATQAVLGYYLALRREVNQQDLLMLLQRCLTPWKPLTLTTPALAYTPGAMFPSALDPASPMCIGTLAFDNALVNQARSVIHLLCDVLGSTGHWGLPAQPKQRWLVESLFNRVNQLMSHRLASTTGSHPLDPVRESRKNRKSPPTVTLRTIDELLSVILTHYNTVPQPGLGNASPLSLFRHHYQTCFLRRLPDDNRSVQEALTGSKVVRLHRRPSGGHAPYIHFYYSRYQGPGLVTARPETKRILIRFDYANIRSVEAFTLEGKPLGTLQAQAAWQRFPHSLGTRQWIHRHQRALRFSLKDPLADYFRYLLDHREDPSVAMQLMRVYREFGGETHGALAVAPTQAPTHSKSRLVWSPALANHQETP